MKMFLVTRDSRLFLHQPHEHADHAIANGACPKCNAVNFGVQGKNQRPSEDDRAWEADGHCGACKASVGTIRVETDTLFGVREDEAVLRGRCRIY